MTPGQLARSDSEHGHQRALFAWANMAATFGFAAAWDELAYSKAGHAIATYGPANSPGLQPLRRLFAIPNGGQRSKITAANLKAEGVKRGVPDIMLPLPMIVEPCAGSARIGTFARYCGLFIEMKRPKGKGQVAGSTSPEQDDWIGYLRNAGYAVSVCFDWRSAAKELQSYYEASSVHAEPQSA